MYKIFIGHVKAHSFEKPSDLKTNVEHYDLFNSAFNLQIILLIENNFTIKLES